MHQRTETRHSCIVVFLSQSGDLSNILGVVRKCTSVGNTIIKQCFRESAFLAFLTQ